ncbi:MAG: TIGR04219 family outer membrane beta-barrel protein [Thermodesulfobacteriota bacterium]
MKKCILLAMMMVLTGFCLTAQADFLRVEAGAGVWQSEPDGDMNYLGDPVFSLADATGFEEESLTYLWAYLKHPVPFVPNVRLEYVETSFDGNVNSPIEWDNTTYVNAYNELSLDQYDAVFYYNLLDNTFWLTLDLGLQFKFVDGGYTLENTGILPLPAVREDFDGVFPMLYVRARANMPGTGFGVEGIGRGLIYGDSNITDLQVKIDYTLDMIPFVKPGLEVGYRIQQLDLDTDDIDMRANVDIDFSGVFAGMTVRF